MTHAIRDSNISDFNDLLDDNVLDRALLQLWHELDHLLVSERSWVTGSDLVRQAHSIISSARILGFEGLAQACVDFERAAIVDSEGVDWEGFIGKIASENELLGPLAHRPPGTP